MASQEELIVKIGADLDELKRGLGKAGKETDKFGKQVKSTGSGVNASFMRMSKAAGAAGIAITALGAALGALAHQTAQNIREQDLWAKRLGVSTENFSALVAVAKQFGAETDDVGDAIKDLNERIADAARGNKTYEEALKMVGLASKDLINLPVEEQFIKVADAIGKMNNVGDQNFTTAELMADAGFRLLEVFRLGEDQIRSMTQAMKDQGLAFDDDGVKASAELNKAWSRLGLATSALGEQILKNIVEPTKKMIEFIEKATMVVRSLAGEDMRTATEKMEGMQRAIERTSKAWAEKIAFMQKWGATQEDIDVMSQKYINKLKMQNEALQEMLGIKKEVKAVDDETVEKAEEQPPSEMADNIALAYQLAGESYAVYERQRIVEAVKAQQELKRIRELENQQRITATKDVFKTLSSLMSSENRKLFEIGKAASIANAVINTYDAANVALKSAPPPFNFALAAATVAAGLANVQQIANTKMGGGGGGGTGGGISTPTSQTEEAQPANVVDATFNIQGSTFSADQVRELGSSLNELVDDGFVLRSVSVN